MNDQERNDESWINQRLLPLESDATAVDRDAIDRARAAATDVWMQTDSQPDNTRRKKMIVKALFGLSALAATILAMLMPAPLDNATFDHRGDQTLGKRLDETLQASTLRLSIDSEGGTATVLVSRATQVRWQDSKTHYQIADATSRWEIDEQAGTADSTASPWHDGDTQQVELLALLGVDAEQSRILREAAPTETEALDGQTRYEFTSAASQSVVHAYYDSATGLLSELQCWPTGRTPQAVARKLFVVARDFKVDESEFVVAEELSKDGRIGKVIDAQGIVTLRPMARDRWTPVGAQMLLKSGDWLRTDARGANACAITMQSGSQLICGPASLIELSSPTEIRLMRGEIKMVASSKAKRPLQLHGPGEASISVKQGQSSHYRIDHDGELKVVTKKPAWLAGFDGSKAVDAIGSLVANIDGRDTPLSVGVHQVKVEIRDQIARTTIEETFINRTSRRLEGVFRFPLPADASISGFGMWIGGELVEADVVEKQRAREIYETILREKRDPGLLEWTGGNVFKARVFPIEPGSEKRIKIVYTQVLPMRGHRYRYSYGLRSEMLQTNPLRELSIDVQVHSELPLKSVACSTHAVRSQQTHHSAKLNFEAQQYTPARDFEVVCEVDSADKDVVVIPHRRGDDGYFMVQLTPPDEDAKTRTAGNWQRELVDDGDPLELLIVCDTSASMDSQKRKDQQRFVNAILSSLSPQDRFSVATCDVDCTWMPETMPEIAEGLSTPTESSLQQVKEWLGERVSLGWTDLDRMAAAVLERTNDKTHVVYVGDGIVTAGDADPQSFVNRLARLTSKKGSAKTSLGTFHAVSVGNSFENVVLRSIAAVGGGSVRQISGEQTPQKVASELLVEITRPGIRNLKVEFPGLQVAAVYPETLPNLAAGTQQILMGRYLPQGTNQSGEIIITGRRGDEPVRFTASMSVADSETGNSFIPRLWARQHLDHLLAQGSNAAMSDQVIAMSEEFHIITPYTSLLVLETDEDRERFGVKRRFQMRDGERFFADGASNANFELLQQQMKRAGEWRLGLRRQILVEMGRLGRKPQRFAQWSGIPRLNARPMATVTSTRGVSSGMVRYSGLSRNRSVSWAGGFAGGGGFPIQTNAPLSSRNAFEDVTRKSESQLGLSDGDIVDRLGDELGWESPNFAFQRRESSSYLAEDASREQLSWSFVSDSEFARDEAFTGDVYYRSGLYTAWFNRLFPRLEPPRTWTRQPPPKPKGSGEAIKLLEGLQTEAEVDPGSGLQVTRQTKSFNTGFDRLVAVDNLVQLSAADRWLWFNASVNSETLVHWADSRQRGVYSKAFQSGQTRDSIPRDIETFQAGDRPFATPEELANLEVSLEANLAESDDRRAVIHLSNPNDPASRQRITIERRRGVVLSIERWYNRKSSDEEPNQTAKYSQYSKTAGVWWPGLIETFDRDGNRQSSKTQKVEVLAKEAFDKGFKELLPDPNKVFLVKSSLPKIRQSMIAVQDGSAGASDRLNLILNALRFQDWGGAMKHLVALERLEADKQALRWIRSAVLASARRNDPALEMLKQLAADLVAGKMTNELMLCSYLVERVGVLGDANETLRMLDQLSPVYHRQPDIGQGDWTWKGRRAYWMRSLRLPETLSLQRELATEAPWNVTAQILYAEDLVTAGDRKAAYAWLDQQIAEYGDALSSETYLLRDRYAVMLREEGRADELVSFLEKWITAEPGSNRAYQQYLTALVISRGCDAADAIAMQWLQDAQIDAPLTPTQKERFDSAVAYAMGKRYQNYSNWMDPWWRQPLADAVRLFLDSQNNTALASQIIGRSRFNQTNESDVLHVEIAERLKTSAESLDAKKVSSFVNWLVARDELSIDDWRTIFDTLKLRWKKAKEKDRTILDQTLRSISKTHLADSVYLPFLRHRLARGLDEDDPQTVTACRHALFSALLSRPWQQEYEDEAAALIGKLGVSGVQKKQAPQANPALLSQVAGLLEFVDKMIESRKSASMQMLREQGEPEALTRTEYAAKLAELSQTAREGVAATLDRQQNVDGELAQWFRLESLHLDVKLRRNLNEVADACWKMLGDKPAEFPEFGNAQRQFSMFESQRLICESERLKRAFAIVRYLAARRSAPQGSPDRVSAYLQAGMRLDSESQVWWRGQRYQWLIVLDKPDTLREELTNWIRTDPLPADWQRSLARLEAELGNTQTAIGIMESIKQSTRLTPQDHASLSDWYLVANRRNDYEQAKISSLDAMEEYQLQRYLASQNQRWWNTSVPLPTELDENVLFAFDALFRKSNQPENYVDLLRRFCEATRDFRLLQMVPDTVTGRTPQQVYPFLRNLSRTLLDEIEKEATADELLNRIEERRSRETAKLDRRALDLLEMFVRRRAATVLNQPGQHIDLATTAMRRAFKGEWAEGEVRQMAELLAMLDTTDMPKLNDQRLRQLQDLRQRCAPGTEDRFYISWQTAIAISQANASLDKGLDGAIKHMESAINELMESHSKGLPANANDGIFDYVRMLVQRNLFAQAERFIEQQIANPLNETQRQAYFQRRNQTLIDAYHQSGEVSLGTRETLYKNLQADLFDQLDTALIDDHRRSVFDQILLLYRTASSKTNPSVKDDLWSFSTKKLPAILPRQQNRYLEMVDNTASLIKQVLGERKALEFLIQRFEAFPDYLGQSSNRPWGRFASEIAQWRKNRAGGIGKLEPRLLSIVLKELRHDLQTRNSQNRTIYHRHNTGFWSQKASDFARVAEEVRSEFPDDPRNLTYVARYLCDSLDRRNRAIAILSSAHEKGLLKWQHLNDLVEYLHEANRHAQAIPILQPLVAARPDDLRHRTDLLKSYFKVKQPGQFNQLLAETESHFRQDGRWTHTSVARLANCCLVTRHHADAVRFFDEAIQMLKRTPREPTQYGYNSYGYALSRYYDQLAQAYSGLGKTREAVDAACAAIVVWGSDFDRRHGQTHRLKQVLQSAKDLDGFVKQLDQKSESTGQGNPLLRKQLGFVYSDRRKHNQAITQLRLAIDLQPSDIENHTKLIEVLDAANESAAAIRQTLALIDHDRHNLSVYTDLAERLKDDAAMSERAITTIVEAAPKEAEHHQAIAEIRQKQNRWPEAILHWKQVAGLRRLEPNGLLKLANAQIHQRDIEAAKETLDALRNTTWPARFNSAENVNDGIRQLQLQLQQAESEFARPQG